MKVTREEETKKRALGGDADDWLFKPWVSGLRCRSHRRPTTSSERSRLYRGPERDNHGRPHDRDAEASSSGRDQRIVSIVRAPIKEADMDDLLKQAKAKAAATYDAAADHFDDEPLSFWERIGRSTVARLDLPAGSNVLDVGCGT